LSRGLGGAFNGAIIRLMQGLNTLEATPVELMGRHQSSPTYALQMNVPKQDSFDKFDNAQNMST
jgi:hypothetical protein